MKGVSSRPGVTWPPFDCDMSLIGALPALSAAAMAIWASSKRTFWAGRSRLEVLRWDDGGGRNRPVPKALSDA